MKPGIHPEYAPAQITCACGRVTETRSTVGEIHVEICSHCHPFFTGRQKLVDTAGRVERFFAKYGSGDAEPEGAEVPAEEVSAEEAAAAAVAATEEATAGEASPEAEEEAAEAEPARAESPADGTAGAEDAEEEKGAAQEA